MNNITFNTPQTAVHISQAKFVACTAGLGSGKTFCIAIKMLRDYFQYKGAHLCYLAPTYSLIADIIYPLLEELLSTAKVPYSLNKTDAVMTVPGYGRIFFRSMTKPEKIIGFSILNAYLDEIDTIPQAQADTVLDKILARVRQKINGVRNQIYLISSPEGFRFMYHNFEKTPLEDSVLIRMTTHDNSANLPDDYISSMMAKYPKSLIDAYLLGKFVNINALGVWSDFDRRLNGSSELAGRADKLIVGMDFNVGRGAAIIHVKRKGFLHAVGEITGSLDTPDTIRQLKKIYSDNPITVYPDASGKSRKSTNFTESDHALLKEAGFVVKANRKNPAVKERILSANALFCNAKNERRYFVNETQCPIYADALEQQVYDDKGMPVKDGKLDDVTDAGTYPIHTLFPIRKASFGTATTGGH